MNENNAASGVDPGFDRLTRDWYIDKIVQALVFIGGISAIIFIIGIFVFISREGFGFLFDEFSFTEFFFSPNWRPTSETQETYGILALVAGTASVTGLAMLIAIPFSLGAAIYIGEFATGRKREYLKVLVELLAAETANSAFHGSRLDVDHIRHVMEDLVAAAERRWGLDRRELAARTVFVSHETYTPARGGSAQAEIDAGRLDVARLRRYRKLQAEDRRNSETLAERRARDRDLGKMYKSVLAGKRHEKKR